MDKGILNIQGSHNNLTLYIYCLFNMRRNMLLKIIFVGERSPAFIASMPNTHMSIFIMVPILADSIETFVALFAAVPELIQMPQHMLLNILFVHECSEAEIADGAVGMFHDVMFVKFTVLLKVRRTHVTTVNVTFPLFNVAETSEFVNKQLLAT